MWLILGGLGGSFAQRFQDVQKNEESSFLPGSSESVRELTLAKRFRSGERFAAITVVRRDGGLRPRDLAAIERTRASLAANPPVTGSRRVLVRVSPDRTTALVIVNLNPRGEETLLKSSVSGVESRMAPLRARTHGQGDGSGGLLAGRGATILSRRPRTRRRRRSTLPALP